jgi:hypothetical protein
MNGTIWSTARRVAGLTLGGVCLAVAAGCGGGGGDDASSTPESTAAATSASATATASSEACADVAALRESIDNLNNLDLPSTGKAGLQSALQDVKTNLEALRASAGDQWAAQVDDFDAAINAFQETVAAIQGDSLLSSIPTIISNVQEIDESWTSLQDQIDQGCPAS